MRGLARDVAYASPMMAVSLLTGAIGPVLQPIYAKYFGLSLAAIAVVLMIGRIIDAVTDPLLGYVADRLTQKKGSPTLLLFSGAALSGVCGYFLFNPFGFDASAENSSVSVFYFGFWYIAYVIADTMVEISHSAWGGALASSADRRTRIYLFRSIFIAFGIMGFFLIPYIHGVDSTEVTPATLNAASVYYLVLAPAVFGLFYVFVVRSDLNLRPEHRTKNANRSILRVYYTILKNKPYRVLTGAQMCTAAASAMYGAMSFFYIDSYLGLGERFAAFFMISFGLGMASLPVWYGVAALIGRRAAWVLSFCLVAVGYAGVSTLGPGDQSWIPFIVFATMVKLGFAPFFPFISAFLSDISDYGTLTNKTDTRSSYFAAFFFISKLMGAVGVAFAYGVVESFGFDASASTQSKSAILGLQITFIWVPACLLVLAAVFAANIPINERRHKIIQRRLEHRAFRSARVYESNSTPRDKREKT